MQHDPTASVDLTEVDVCMTDVMSPRAEAESAADGDVAARGSPRSPASAIDTTHLDQAMTTMAVITVDDEAKRPSPTAAAPAPRPSDGASPRTSPRSSPKAKPDSIYWVKRTKFLQRDVLYICQNVNGPCPLLAICNVLLLRGHLHLDACVRATPAGQGYVYARDVMELVQQRILATNAHFSEAEKATVQEVVDLIPSLHVGLDVNVQFHAIDAFEYTSALAIFDLLAMRLVHGWVVDPQDVATASVIGTKSYNHIIETVIDHHSVGDDSSAAASTMVKERSLSMEDAVAKVQQVQHDGPIIEQFLAESANQLTFAGLVLLHEDGIKERELAVFFRNNHFSTIFKIHGALYLLATDAGYYDEPSVIWENSTRLTATASTLRARLRRSLPATRSSKRSWHRNPPSRRRP
ncbi:hypothetical protein SPRG_09336 [Saprolegnia parasitica CBS 223.65]|uniref:MINDY deubiquitinase domain-containing protein n=1 Tax=Saprolegnia parasitica (strain CBS 223.65) TaxID=695850 RepID=A0A067C3N2_SAPPC|nr:hypothetical protein SPRG_09336 [Saprolegnia parasitica CBS 223.65]KDO25394.1 hypothetical protein SPRG_09336 [Saprolegnia parasitica CBS 223.65]|eukprot:XP_012203822.1 hypothetical protein SPRG_09336 [Saprolegnia parasitica CBS 223.65]